MKEGLGIFVFVLGCVFLLIAVSSFTGLSVLSDVSVDSEINSGDDITFLASINNSAGNDVSVWASIWDNTGGLIWSGLMSLLGGKDSENESWGVNVSTDTPPFPEIVGNESFDYAVYMNDSNGDVTNKTGDFIIRAKGENNLIQLKKGWNMIAFSFSDSDKVEDKKIELNQGWNLVGYSSKKAPTADLSISASVEGVVNSKASYFDSDRGSYQLASLSDGEFEPNHAYWVYSNSKAPVNLIVEGASGDEVGMSKPVSELKFRNVTTGEEKGIAEAKTLWGMNIKYYDPKGWATLYDNVNSWDGYFVFSPSDDIVIVG